MNFEVNSRLAILFGLYFLQGLPYGLQVKFLPLILRNENFSLSLIGFTRLLSLPWLLKAAFAPVVDRCGSLHIWITVCLSGTAVLYALPAITGAKYTKLLLSCILGLNVFAAIEDIAVDAFAMKLLHFQELGKVNAAQVVGYKVGMLFGGGVLLWLTDYTSWGVSFFVLSGVYVISAALSSWLKNLKPFDPYHQMNKHSDTKPTSCENIDYSHADGFGNVNPIQETCNHDISIKKQQLQMQQHNDNENIMQMTRKGAVSSQPKENKKYSRSTLKEILSDYRKVYCTIWHTPGFRWLAFYVVFYKLGEQGVVSMFPLFLVDSGYSVSKTGFVSGMLGQVCSIAGSAMGGWFINANVRFGTYEVLFGALVLRLFPMTAQCLLAMHGINTVVVLLSECFLQFFAGVITVATFTLMMHNSKFSLSEYQATHFSTLATIEVLGKLTMISFSGMFVDRISYLKFFSLCTFLSLAVPFIVRCLLRNGAFAKKEL